MRYLGVTCAALLTLSLAACGNKESSDDTAQGPVPGTALNIPAAPQVTPEQLEAESSLAIKRGVVTLTAQTRSIRLCGSNIDLTLVDQLDGALDRTYEELGSKPIYVEVYGERGDVQHGAEANSFGIEELLYATSAEPAAECAASLGKFDLLARGSEPTWSVEVQQDAMVFRQMSAPTEIKFTGVETADAEGTVTYRAGVDRHVLELVITQHPCRDAAAYAYYAYSASARLDKQTLNGCARVGE